VFSIVALFAGAYGVPAGIRLVDSFVPEHLQTLSLIFVISLLTTMPKPFGDTYFNTKDCPLMESSVIENVRKRGQYGTFEGEQ
jgi:hypothetical protein